MVTTLLPIHFIVCNKIWAINKANEDGTLEQKHFYIIHQHYTQFYLPNIFDYHLLWTLGVSSCHCVFQRHTLCIDNNYSLVLNEHPNKTVEEISCPRGEGTLWHERWDSNYLHRKAWKWPILCFLTGLVANIFWAPLKNRFYLKNTSLHQGEITEGLVLI